MDMIRNFFKKKEPKTEIKPFVGRISLVGDTQIEALAWYVRRLPEIQLGAQQKTAVCNFLVEEKFKNVMEKRFSERFHEKMLLDCLPDPHRLVEENVRDARYNTYERMKIQDLIERSDVIIFQKFEKKSSKILNYENIKLSCPDHCKLISVSSFLHHSKKVKFLKKMRRKDNSKGVSLKASKLIDEFPGIITSTDKGVNKPNVQYYLKLLQIICNENGWQYFSKEEEEKYLRIKFPFG